MGTSIYSSFIGLYIESDRPFLVNTFTSQPAFASISRPVWCGYYPLEVYGRMRTQLPEVSFADYAPLSSVTMEEYLKVSNCYNTRTPSKSLCTCHMQLLQPTRYERCVSPA
ncbi:hypothetical protein GDO78_010904 [Eleutherodactylus coqui]|uniref:Uncharacterized protein n=1 Tax=Eleutherodactylus coqui TaxID=57060 RepID=A0A8J6F7D7_ELECQ|nr:hypothetical protein GDO78_010904 [Eleutherodactylus coqui]